MKHKTKEMMDVACSACGDVFQRDAARVRSKLKWGYKTFYCSPKCQRSNRKLPWAELNERGGV